jgi:hypothetical protein
MEETIVEKTQTVRNNGVEVPVVTSYAKVVTTETGRNDTQTVATVQGPAVIASSETVVTKVVKEDPAPNRVTTVVLTPPPPQVKRSVVTVIVPPTT